MGQNALLPLLARHVSAQQRVVRAARRKVGTRLKGDVRPSVMNSGVGGSSCVDAVERPPPATSVDATACWPQQRMVGGVGAHDAHLRKVPPVANGDGLWP